jgi:hypothetical protein
MATSTFTYRLKFNWSTGTAGFGQADSINAGFRRRAAILRAETWSMSGNATPVRVLTAEFVHDKKSDIEWRVEVDANDDGGAQTIIKALFDDFAGHGNIDRGSLKIRLIKATDPD